MEITKMNLNVEENNQKYLIIKKITAIFMSIILSLLILLFLYFASKNSYTFFYIIFFFIICADIDAVYNSSLSNNVIITNETETKDSNNVEIINDGKKEDDPILQKLLKKIKKMNKQISRSKIEIDNLKKTIQQTHSEDQQNDEATTVVSSEPHSPGSDITTSDLEKLIDESIKQFESDDMIFVDHDNVD